MTFIDCVGLYHYGVLGMKWGVRKDRRTSENNGDVVIKSGTVIKRFSDSKEDKVKAGKEHVYAAYKPQDINNYMSALEKKYEISFMANENLISPSKKKRVDAFIEEFHKNPKSIADEVAKFQKDNYLFALRSQKSYAKVMLRMSEEKLREKGYKVFQRSLVDSQVNRERFFSNLQSKGYNMIMDDNDIRGRLAEAPILVFNRTGSLTRVGYKKISEKEMDAAIENFRVIKSQ